MNNKINYKETIYSDGNPLFLSKKSDFLVIKLRLYKKNDIKQIFLVTHPEGERIYKPMTKIKTEKFFCYWHGKIKITVPAVSYKFFLVTQKESFWYSQYGITNYIPPDIYDFKYIIDYTPIKWLENSVFYQIFPDRFYDGDPSNNVKDNEYTYCGLSAKVIPWGNTPREYDPKVHLQFTGGDLAGIKQKLSYFKNLGVNALYLTPVFLSPSPHKYDVQDYYKIDPHFGTNKEFAELVKLLHESKIKIILDGVFNHCGISHYWFNKCGFYKTKGAYNSKDSPFYEFFKFYNFPEDYKSWLGVKSLPKLNYQSEKLKDIIYREKNSIAKFWLKSPYNTDGWRLDVANMQARDDSFQGYKEIWPEFRQEIKKINPQAYILGEHFFDPAELLQGDMLDGVMNYQGFYFPVISWFAKKFDFPVSQHRIYAKTKFTAQDLEKALTTSQAQIPWQIQKQMYNLLNSHDTPRFYSLINKNKKLYKGALIFLFTYPGVPAVFYGDEIGLEGKNSIDSRCCMAWNKNKQDKELFFTYKKLINLKRNNRALAGGFKVLLANSDIFSYAHFTSDETVISVINRGNAVKINLPLWKIGKTSGKLKDMFTGKEFKIKKGNVGIKLNKQESLCLLN